MCVYTFRFIKVFNKCQLNLVSTQAGYSLRVISERGCEVFILQAKYRL